MSFSRRGVLLGSAALALAGRANAAAPPQRIAAIDWAMLETAVALGVMPVAATELIQFHKDAVEPAIPDNVIDLGLRGSVNLELLHLVKPDLILISPFYTRHEATLSAIAPTLSLPFYVKGEPPFEKALGAVRALGERLGRSQEAAHVETDIRAALETMRQSLARFTDRPTYLVNIGDSRHVRIFGSDSMFGDILVRLGFRNAWPDRSRFTFAAPVPIENLAVERDARIVIVSDIPVEARSRLRSSMIWNALEPVSQGRVLQLPNIAPYGGVTAGMRFARLFAEALQSEGAGR
ncbi:iron complex transport system substrate-binding protein [Neorhizobium huautlense]|uniref:Iron complex transport system substrate-binding protein n=1 Tax=Neorhizobium huautlense TaxID=67774 RepID=A0ABT9PLZ7_9HYPH|nr:iron-siderophore ABC transporter substrate-binding protein [Neorhizobium huautlense]MDP9835493.1 iron complex transport system substrate-binding protein [Neorhizobium huautlense]